MNCEGFGERGIRGGSGTARVCQRPFSAARTGWGTSSDICWPAEPVLNRGQGRARCRVCKEIAFLLSGPLDNSLNNR